jgi:hypothetical protein
MLKNSGAKLPKHIFTFRQVLLLAETIYLVKNRGGHQGARVA